MTNRAFTEEAIERCERRGHRFAYVPGWGGGGHEECACGETRHTGTPAECAEKERLAMERRAAAPARADRVWRPRWTPPADDRPRCTPPPTCKQQRFDNPAPRVARAPRRRHGNQEQRDKRRAEILALLASGVPRTEVARRAGVTGSRISQIASAERRRLAAIANAGTQPVNP